MADNYESNNLLARASGGRSSKRYSEAGKAWVDIDAQTRKLSQGSNVVAKHAKSAREQLPQQLVEGAVKNAVSLFLKNGGQRFVDDRRRYEDNYKRTGNSGFTQSELIERLEYFERWNNLVTNEYELRRNVESGNPMLYALQHLSMLIEKAKDFYGEAISDNIPEEISTVASVKSFAKRKFSDTTRNLRLKITEPFRQAALSDTLHGVILRSMLGKIQRKKKRGFVGNSILKLFNLGTDIGGVNYIGDRGATTKPGALRNEDAGIPSLPSIKELPTVGNNLTNTPVNPNTTNVNSIPSSIAQKSLMSRLGGFLGNTFGNASVSVKNAFASFNTARNSATNVVSSFPLGDNNQILDANAFKATETSSLNELERLNEEYSNLVIANIEEVGEALVKGTYRGKALIFLRANAQDGSGIDFDLPEYDRNKKGKSGKIRRGGSGNVRSPMRKRRLSGLRRFIPKAEGGKLNSLFSKAGKNVAETGLKKEATKVVAKQGMKASMKAGAKSVAKKIPGVGAIASLGFAGERLAKNDILGAFGEVASGLAGTIPVIGTAASLAIDGLLLAKDLNEESKETLEQDKQEGFWAGLFGGNKETKRSLAAGGTGGSPGTGNSIYYDTFSKSSQSNGSISARPSRKSTKYTMTPEEAAAAKANAEKYNPDLNFKTPTNVNSITPDIKQFGKNSKYTDANLLTSIYAAQGTGHITGLLAEREESRGDAGAVTLDTNNVLSLGKYQFNAAEGGGSFYEMTNYLKNSKDPEQQQIGRELEAARIAETGSAKGALTNKEGATAQIVKKYRDSEAFKTGQLHFAEKFFLTNNYDKYKENAPGLVEYLEKNPVAKEAMFATQVQFGQHSNIGINSWNQAKGNAVAFNDTLNENKYLAFKNSKREANKRLAPAMLRRTERDRELTKVSLGLEANSSASGMIEMKTPSGTPKEQSPTSVPSGPVSPPVDNTAPVVETAAKQATSESQSSPSSQNDQQSDTTKPIKPINISATPQQGKPSIIFNGNNKEANAPVTSTLYIDDPATQSFRHDPLTPIDTGW